MKSGPGYENVNSIWNECNDPRCIKMSFEQLVLSRKIQNLIGIYSPFPDVGGLHGPAYLLSSGEYKLAEAKEALKDYLRFADNQRANDIIFVFIPGYQDGPL